MLIRPERPDDYAAVTRLHEAAFGRPDEARLVEVLRLESAPQVSLVAERDATIVGHLFFSPVTIDGALGPPMGGLGPLAVVPSVQRQGIGLALARAGLAACRPVGWRAAVVLGEPGFYERVGFVLGAPLGLRYERAAFDAHFQVQELEAGSLAGCRGWVRYHPAFERV